MSGDVSVAVDGVSATGAISNVNVWGIIDASQTPDFSTISSSQSPSWSTVDASQTPGWTKIAA